MSVFDGIGNIQRDQKLKLLNAAIDKKTHALIPKLEERFRGIKIAGNQVGLAIELDIRSTHDLAIIKVESFDINMKGSNAPLWLVPSGEPVILFQARFLENGKIVMSRNKNFGTTAIESQYNTDEELLYAIEHQLTVAFPQT